MAKPVNIVIKGEYNDKDINRAIGDLKKMQTAGTTVGGKMQAFGTKMQDMGRTVGAVGKGLTLGLTMPVVGVGIAALAAGATFEKSMNKVRAVSGVTGEEFEQLKIAAKEMGRTTQFSASEAADGMTFLAMAGFKTNEIVSALPATLNLAAVGEMDLATAADIASNVLGGFNMAAEKTNKVVDVMAKVSANANTSVAQMGEAMSYAAPIANTAGISIESAAAFIGRLGDAGIQGSRAGTTLVGVIGAIENATPKAAKRLKELGIVTHDSAGNMLPLDKIVQQLGTSSITAGDYLSIFGKRAGPGLAAVVGMGVDGLTALEQKAIDSGGAAEHMSNVQLEGLAGQMVKLKSAFEGLLIGIAESGLMTIVTDFFVKLTEKVSGLVKKIDEMSPESKKMILMFVGIAAAIGPVLIVVGKVMVAIGGLIKIFGGITVAGTLIAAKFIVIAAVIAAFVAAVIYAWKTSEPFRTALQNLWATLKSLADMIKTQVIDSINNMTGSSKGLQDILQRLGNFLSGALTVAVNIITGAVKLFGAAFQVALKIFEVGVTILKLIANVIKGVVLAAFDIWMNKLGPVSTALRAVAENAKKSFSTIATVVRAAFNNAGKFVEGFINFAITALNKLIQAYNILAGMLPNMSRISEIQEFRFQQLAGATAEVGNTASRVTGDMGLYYQQLASNQQATNDAADATLSLEDILSQLNLTQDENTNATKNNTAASKEATKALDKYKEKFNEVAARLKAAREQIQRDYEGMVKSVQAAIMGGINLQGALPEYNEAGELVGKSFIEKLTEQAERAKEFAEQVRHLITSGLSRDAIQMVLAAGVDAGTNIAKELIAGGSDTIAATNELIDTTKTAADKVGIFAADSFFGTGLALAKKTEAAFLKRFGPGGPGWNKLNNLMTHLARSLDRTSTITVVTEHVTRGVPGRRMGGPVAAGSPYIVGEAGPELFVPTLPGRIVPNHDLGSSMTGRTAGVSMAAASTTINLTVNAGMGADGAEVGRQIVDALKSYERRNGPVFVAA
jgi:TP901 family phage tail tape measure protein